MNRSDHDALYVGLISGTSMDGIDAGVFRFGTSEFACLASTTTAYSDELRNELAALRTQNAQIALDALGQLDVSVGHAFADAALAAIRAAGVAPTDISAIGSHGQTVRHNVSDELPFTLQVGDPHTIAARTGCVCVADFRRADVARGGQGAPLLPLLHDWLFCARRQPVAVLNLGGIANVTLLPVEGPLVAFDTGPANILIDQWLQAYAGEAFDRGGRRASAGTVNEPLLAAMLDEPYFAEAAPKSTGFELFNLGWLDAFRSQLDTMSADDTVATLTGLTIRSIARAISGLSPQPAAVWVAGGGVHNPVMLAGLRAALTPTPIDTMATMSIDPDQLEAAGFAWLARERMAGRLTRHTEVTGAATRAPLGVIVAP